MSAIYIHIPFCKRLCGYCDFFKSVKLQYLEPVLDAIAEELVAQRHFLHDQTIETIYFGGGTPSLLSAAQVASLLDVIANNYDLNSLSEVTLEANPDDLTLEYLTEIRKCGVNRLSIGVQSFDDGLLKFMNRRHDAQRAVDAVRMAQSVGYDNITIDLIFGVDGFGEASLRSSIATALSLGVQHISAYHLTVEENTPFARRVARGEMRLVDEMISQSEYLLMDRELTAAGFQHYEISNYALDGFRSKHNSSYWHGVHYLGVGPAAHSFNGEQRRYAVESIDGYLAGGESRYTTEELSEVDHYNEFIMTSLRCVEGVDMEQLREGFPPKFAEYFMRGANDWISTGKLCCQNGRIHIPSCHFLISDNIIESLFYC